MVITAGFPFFLTIRLLVVDIFVDRKKPLNISFSGIFLNCQQRYLKKINIVIRRKGFGTEFILIKVSSALLTLTAGIKSRIEILSRRGRITVLSLSGRTGICRRKGAEVIPPRLHTQKTVQPSYILDVSYRDIKSLYLRSGSHLHRR